MYFLFLLPFLTLVLSQSDGYIGYSLHERGDPDSVLYETANTIAGNDSSTSTTPPDVYLNASVSVGEIDIQVQNLTAQINLQAQVLSLLNFNAGVDVSIDSVNLLIRNVTAKVLLEARLGNLVTMIGSVLNSLDLNPVLATLGQAVGNVTNDLGNAVGGVTSGLAARGEDYNLVNNVLYSVNDYSGNTHTNRVLAQNGDIVEETLDNDGNVKSDKVVGNYKTDMTYSGHNLTTTRNGQPVYELEYTYTPIPGIMSIAAIIFDNSDKLIATQVLAESSAGGSSTIGNEVDL